MYKNYQNPDPFTALDANSVMRQGIVPVASLTERNRLVAHKGMTIYRTDLNREERFDGSNWVANEPEGLVIYPASVTGATVSANGTIVPNGVLAISANGVFSTKYRHYRIDYWYRTNESTGSWVQFRANGVNHDAAKYSYQLAYDQGSNLISVESQNNPQMGVAGASAVNHFGSLHIYNPAHSGANVLKTFNGIDNGVFNLSQTRFGGALLDADNLAFDGFAFSLSNTTAAFSTAAPCSFKVYAYN